MALVILAPPYLQQVLDIQGSRPPTVHGRSSTSRIVKVDLANSAYVTNGWPLVSAQTGLVHVSDIRQLCGYDPLGGIITTPTVLAQYVATDPSRPLLKLIDTATGVEAANASTRSGVLWLQLIGRDA